PPFAVEILDKDKASHYTNKQEICQSPEYRARDGSRAGDDEELPWSLSDLQSQAFHICAWILEIHTRMTNNLSSPSRIFNNYVDESNNASVPSFEGALNFPKASDAALLRGRSIDM
ncbi:hypothetical protein FRB96_004834, partial [Tulasnella sp. 330]